MKRAVLMARVSSDEQALGYSLGIQEDNLKQYCQNNNIAVVSTFREDHSAKNFDRPEFQTFLTSAKKNKGQIDYLLFTTWDRFSRNIQDAYQMIDILKKLGIQPMAIQQPIDLTIPENKMMLAVYLVIPEIDNDRRSIKIREGIRKSLQTGRWCNAAPRGYSYSKDHHSRSVITPNAKAPHIRYLFEEYDRGITQADIIRALKQKGFNIGRSMVSKILRNPVYMGKVYIPANDSQPAELIKGIHEAIISEALFYQVQARLNGFKKSRNLPLKTMVREELPFRGFLLCSECGYKLTGSASRSRNKQRYFYYHCNRCGKERYKAELADTVISKVISELHVEEQVKDLYRTIVQVIFKGTETERNNRKETIMQEVRKYESRILNLQDMLADGDLTSQDYSAMKGRFEIQIQNLLHEHDTINSVRNNWEKYLDSGISIMSNLQLYWKSADSARKLALLGSIFPEKLEISGKKCRTARINEFFRLILQETRELQKQKTGQLTPHLLLSRPVETRGIEPLTS